MMFRSRCVLLAQCVGGAIDACGVSGDSRHCIARLRSPPRSTTLRLLRRLSGGNTCGGKVFGELEDTVRLLTILRKIQKYLFVLGFQLHPDLVYFQDTSCTTDVAHVHFFLNGQNECHDI